MKAIVYFTYGGIISSVDGIGTQTKTILSSIQKYYTEFAKIYGDFHFLIITPKEISDEEKQVNLHWQYAYNIVRNTSGDIIEIPFGENDFWTLEAWDCLSRNASEQLEIIASKYSNVLAITIDPPYLHVPIYFNSWNKNNNVKFLVTLFSSSYIHEKNNLRLNRLSWEYVSISSARVYDNVYLANIGKFMKQHLIDYYGADLQKFVPFKSSIDIAHSDFYLISKINIGKILEKYKVPLDKEIILAYGRADWIKGFDILLNQMPKINSNVHLVLIVVPYADERELINSYKALIDKHSIKCSLYVGYNRELPRALCQYKNTKIVVIPSRGEPLSNIPFEVSLWAREEGPVCLCSDIDGFQEQISNGHNGFLFDLKSETDLATKIEFILSINEEEFMNLRKNAVSIVLNERDFKANFIRTLEYFN